MFSGTSRPKTAAVAGLPRPPTAVHNTFTKGRAANNMTVGGGYGAFNFIGQRPIHSAGFINNPRVKRYEDIIQRLKKMLANEKKSLRMVRTLCSKEIETKN